MEQSLGEDLGASHAVLNYLHAVLQGKFAYLNMLSQLAYHEFNPDEIGRTQEDLAKVQRWSEQLWQGHPILSRSTKMAQTPAAKEALALCGKSRQDLSHGVLRIERIIGLPDLHTREDDVRYLIASYARYAYTRDNFIRGYIAYGNNFSMPELVEQFSSLLPEAEQIVDSAHLFFDVWINPEAPVPLFYRGLLEEAVFLPGTFRTFMHDLWLHANMYGAIGYDTVGIPLDQAPGWASLGIDPSAAGYWVAFGFDPSTMSSWGQLGVVEPRMAHFWRVMGFSPFDAEPWIRLGFPPVIARDWAHARFSPEEAIRHIEDGATSPEDALRRG